MPAIPSDALLDVNVLIAAVFADHPHHVASRSFVSQVTRIYSTPTTQGGFLRFATRPWKDTGARQFPPRLSMADGLAALKGLTATTGHIFLGDDASFDELANYALRGHRQWTDAYLFHLARKHKIILATFDAAIGSLEWSLSPDAFFVELRNDNNCSTKDGTILDRAITLRQRCEDDVTFVHGLTSARVYSGSSSP